MRLIPAILIAAVFLVTNTVLAQDSTTSATTNTTTNRFTGIPARVETGRKTIDAKITAGETRITANIDDRRIKIASMEATFRAKLQTFRNQTKAQIAQKVNTQLNTINLTETTQMQSNLDKMSSIVDKLEVRINQAAPDVKNVDAARTAIADARTAIASASSAVKTQAANSYIIQVTTESRIRIDAEAIRNQLQKDLKTTRNLVIEAKQSVYNIVAVAKTGSNTASSSANIKEGTVNGQ